MLRSGRRSRYYLDKYGLRPTRAARRVGHGVAALQRDFALGAAGRGPPSRHRTPLAAVGVGPIGPAIAWDHPEEGQAEEDNGTTNHLEGVAAEQGNRVCIIKDLVTSSSTLLDTVAALREAELDVCAAICVADREEGALRRRRAGVRFTRSLWSPISASRRVSIRLIPLQDSDCGRPMPVVRCERFTRFRTNYPGGDADEERFHRRRGRPLGPQQEGRGRGVGRGARFREGRPSEGRRGCLHRVRQVQRAGAKARTDVTRATLAEGHDPGQQGAEVLGRSQLKAAQTVRSDAQASRPGWRGARVG